MKSSRAWVLVVGLASTFALLGGPCETVTSPVCGNGFNRATGSGEFGDSEDAQTVEEFFDAVAAFDSAATSLIDDAEELCRALGEDIGVDAADMPVGNAAATCTAVSEKMQEDFATMDEANVELIVEVALPVCSASIEAAGECYARCDADFNAEVTPVTCTGGEVYIDCDVGCAGECRLPDATAECEGSCEGTCTGECAGSCSGGCTGSCVGWCDGTCDSFDPETGQCVGACDGVCHGECDATCEGYCYGECTGSCDIGCVVEVNDMGGCDGECWGTCDADVEPVRCEGGEIDVDASVECEAACEAQLAFEAECTEPVVFVGFIGDTEAIIDLAEDYADALETHLPGLVDLIMQMGVVVEATIELIDAAADGIELALEYSTQAAACAIMAVEIVVEVDIEFSLTVNAATSVSSSLDVDTGVEGREY